MAACLVRLGVGGGRAAGKLLGCTGVVGRCAPSPPPLPAAPRPLHTSPPHQAGAKGGPRLWQRYNSRVYPPTPIGEQERPAYICHVNKNIKYSPDKMWYVACLVRGLPIDEAIAQLHFVHRKGATMAIQTLEEARQLAIQQHHVEFPSNLWVAESFVGKGIVYKGIRRHARQRLGKVEYKHCHYFVTLEEGRPPSQYYTYKADLSPEEMLSEYLQGLRKRSVTRAL